jgi:hypothetical protein
MNDVRVIAIYTAGIYRYIMTEFFSETIKKFDVAFDLKGEGIFKEGHTFEPMTYKSLCEHVAYESCRLGGAPLRPQRRLDDSGLIDYVNFYCPHGRKHVDQAGRKDVKNPSSSRASRVNEDRRVMYCDCDFHLRVVRDPKVLPIQVVEDEHEESVVFQQASSSPSEGVEKGLSKLLHDSTIFGWYVDCRERQQQEGRYCRRNYHCFTHNDHVKRSQPIADVDERMRKLIKDDAQHNISIGSIGSKIFSKFGVYVSDEQLRFELLKLDIHVREGRIDLNSHGNMSSSQNFVNTMLMEQNLSVAFLFENLTTSSEICIVYDTYVNDKLVAAGDQSVGVDVSKAKDLDVSVNDVVEHGRIYDKNRMVVMPGCSDNLFLVGLCWVNCDELRVFQHYPEVLVVDSKANTNKYKKAFFSGVGIDGLWKNCTLFRSWIPNQTEAAYAWLLTRALPLLIPVVVLQKIQVIMSDADATMGSVITGCCGSGKYFPHAIHCFCVYHFERNFFQEFGVGCKSFGLQRSRTTRRKGGNIEWGHHWQKELVSSIYRCQKCETETEFEACKNWIFEYIDLHPDLSTLLKRKLSSFFSRKFDLHRHWIHMHRSNLRHLGIVSSSRIEGEFGAIWFLRLHANTTLRHAFEKLRWASNRRRKKKIAYVEDSLSKWVKRKSDIIDDEDWQFLVKNFTKYYTLPYPKPGLGPEDNCAVVAEAKRPPAYNMAFAQRMQMAIEGALPAKSPLWKEYCMFQKQFLDNVTRRCITQPGVGAHLRKRGIADAAQGRGRQGHKRKQPSEKQHLSTHHRSNDDEESSDDEQPMGWTVVGLTGNRARAILKKGAATDWILEVYPDIEASQYKEGDRWFAKVVDGRIFGLSNSLEIGGVRWCKTNSIQVDPAYPEPVRLEVSMVIAYGPSTAPMFQKFKE